MLALEYGDRAYFGAHSLTVDTYAVQHPGVPERRSVRSLALHLITLCLVLERSTEPADTPRLHKRLAKHHGFEWLEPPSPNGRVTVADVRGASDAGEHERRVRTWAEDVWAAWAPHQATVRGWIDRGLGEG